MPELPEVETVIRSLRSPLLGRRIDDVSLSWKNMLVRPSMQEFREELLSSRFVSLDRRGKYLLFRLERKSRNRLERKTLIIHLKMSGNLNVRLASLERERHDRVIFALDDGNELRFNDTRKFGRVFLVPEAEDVVGKLGPEPLDPGFSKEIFRALFAGRRGALKPLLLNQSFIAGIGNIYADESLWRAKLHPKTECSKLGEKECAGLFKAIRETLALGIKYCGTDSGDGVVPYGSYRTKVYGRGGKPCPRCRTPIERIVVAQRGTHLCPACQPQPRLRR